MRVSDMKIQDDFPKIILVELPKDKLVTPFGKKITPKTLQTILDNTMRGIVNKDGTWRQKPDETWKISREGEGLYMVVHTLGYKNTSLSISLLEQPGSFKVIEHSPTLFVVETTLNQKRKDFDFSFSLIRAIEPAT